MKSNKFNDYPRLHTRMPIVKNLPLVQNFDNIKKWSEINPVTDQSTKHRINNFRNPKNIPPENSTQPEMHHSEENNDPDGLLGYLMWAEEQVSKDANSMAGDNNLGVVGLSRGQEVTRIHHKVNYIERKYYDLNILFHEKLLKEKGFADPHDPKWSIHENQVFLNNIVSLCDKQEKNINNLINILRRDINRLTNSLNYNKRASLYISAKETYIKALTTHIESCHSIKYAARVILNRNPLIHSTNSSYIPHLANQSADAMRRPASSSAQNSSNITKSSESNSGITLNDDDFMQRRQKALSVPYTVKSTAANIISHPFLPTANLKPALNNSNSDIVPTNAVLKKPGNKSSALIIDEISSHRSSRKNLPVLLKMLPSTTLVNATKSKQLRQNISKKNIPMKQEPKILSSRQIVSNNKTNEIKGATKKLITSTQNRSVLKTSMANVQSQANYKRHLNRPPQNILNKYSKDNSYDNGHAASIEHSKALRKTYMLNS